MLIARVLTCCADAVSFRRGVGEPRSRRVCVRFAQGAVAAENMVSELLRCSSGEGGVEVEMVANKSS